MSQDAPLLSIGDVAARAGVRTSTLRYYEAEGLIVSDERVGGRRRYRTSAVEQLAVIRFCQTLGFSLAEIRDILARPRGQAQKARWRELADAKIADLDVQECATRASASMKGGGGERTDR